MELRTRLAALENFLAAVDEMATRPISVSAPGAPNRAALLVSPAFLPALAAAKHSKPSTLEAEIKSLQDDKTTLLLVLSAKLAEVERMKDNLKSAKEALLEGEKDSSIHGDDDLLEEIAGLLSDALCGGVVDPARDREIAAKVDLTLRSLIVEIGIVETVPVVDPAEASERATFYPDEAVPADSPDAPYNPDDYLPADRRGEEAEDDEDEDVATDDRPYESGLALERTRDLTAEG